MKKILYIASLLMAHAALGMELETYQLPRSKSLNDLGSLKTEELNKISDLREELSDLGKEIKQSRTRLNGLTNKTNIASTKVASIELGLEEYLILAQTLEQKIDELKEALELNQQYSTLLEQFKSRLKDNNTKIDELTNSADIAVDKATSAKIVSDLLAKEHHTLLKDNQQYSMTIKELKSQLKELNDAKAIIMDEANQVKLQVLAEKNLAIERLLELYNLEKIEDLSNKIEMETNLTKRAKSDLVCEEKLHEITKNKLNSRDTEIKAMKLKSAELGEKKIEHEAKIFRSPASSRLQLFTFGSLVISLAALYVTLKYPTQVNDITTGINTLWTPLANKAKELASGPKVRSLFGFFGNGLSYLNSLRTAKAS
jgi:chromosome segregation ATPase